METIVSVFIGENSIHNFGWIPESQSAYCNQTIYRQEKASVIKRINYKKVKPRVSTRHHSLGDEDRRAALTQKNYGSCVSVIL